jgi:hypothetical protein
LHQQHLYRPQHHLLLLLQLLEWLRGCHELQSAAAAAAALAPAAWASGALVDMAAAPPVTQGSREHQARSSHMHMWSLRSWATHALHLLSLPWIAHDAATKRYI